MRVEGAFLSLFLTYYTKPKRNNVLMLPLRRGRSNIPETYFINLIPRILIACTQYIISTSTSLANTITQSHSREEKSSKLLSAFVRATENHTIPIACSCSYKQVPTTNTPGLEFFAHKFFSREFTRWLLLWLMTCLLLFVIKFSVWLWLAIWGEHYYVRHDSRDIAVTCYYYTQQLAQRYFCCNWQRSLWHMGMTGKLLLIWPTENSCNFYKFVVGPD